MRNGDFYQNYKGGEYYFECIALPVGEIKHLNPRFLVKDGIALDAHTPDEVEEPQELQLFSSQEGTLFIASPYPHVIYQAEKDYNTNRVWARRVDDFFGNVPLLHNVRRFELKERRS